MPPTRHDGEDTMKVGLMAPQGWKGEYDGWDPASAWARTVDLARDAEALGFESVWAFDHFHTVPKPTEEITFESFSVLAALAMVTSRVRLGHMVVCTGFRNPGLTAKLTSTIDVISGGRFELGIGAGWKEDEWRAYGYGFPTVGERLGALRDHLEIVTRMLAPGPATYQGAYASVKDAINEPKGLQSPRPPIIVGGNGENVTFRLAAKFADELNLVFVGPERIAQLLPIARSRCEEIGRDPATLRVSLYTRDDDIRDSGQARVDLLGACQDLGLSRLIAFPGRWSVELEAQAELAADCRVAGLDLVEPLAVA
jgi:F420-dependent oxidoreductase-like protein